MRKRLIGKAFAVAMSGAMVLTATPVTANLFNVAHIVKAAEDAQKDEWTYCYVGLTWAEYWANEGVYNADNTTSSSIPDDRSEYDKGGYDVVTRATTNHGLHRGSYQCMATIYTTATDGSTGPEYKVSHWSADGKTIYLTNGKSVGWAKGKISDGDTTYTMDHYEVSGIKYVPVKVKTADLSTLKKSHTVIENGSLMVGGYGEGNLKAYSETANVTANTYGLKTAEKQSDGSFTFTARNTEGNESGIKNQALKTVSGVTTNITPYKDSKGNPVSVGAFGEAIRVDLLGNYGDLGANMQAVKWTYYGNDSSRTTAVRTFGTKFASDNWMHKANGIQLGLTNSFRYELPKDYDGTGYWSLTVYALGYNDYTIDFEISKDNIAVPKSATEDEKADLQKLVSEASAFNKDSYCKGSDKETAFANLQTELDETKDLLAKENLLSAEATEQSSHLTSAINAVKALKTHEIETVTTPATTEKEGSIVEQCKHCGEIFSTKTIAKLPPTTTTAKPSATTTVTNTTTVKVKAPAKTTVKLSKAKKTSLKVSWKKVSGVAAYQIQYSTSKNFKKAKTIKVSAKSASKVLKKLKKNKKYYVRVKSYKVTKVNNKSKNVYSAWSASKALKTKKK